MKDDRIETANEVHEKIVSRYLDRDAGLGVLTNDQLAAFGKTLWELTYKDFQDDNDALEAMISRISQAASVDPGLQIVAEALMHMPHEQMKAMWAARWVDQGCPRITVEGRFASLLMSTDAGPEVADMVVPPWKSFMIEIPEGILTAVNPRTNTESSLRRVFVQQLVDDKGELVWNFIAESNDALQLWRHGLSTRDCLVFDDGRNTVDWSEAAFTESIETQDERVILLVGRLIVSTCLSLSDPTNFHEQKKTKGRGKRWRVSGSGPEIRTFVLGRPIKIDCRQSIRDFIHNRKQEGSRLTVQFLVRGHWKNQAHGPGHSLRKLIHIEPYWKGPEEARIVTKSVHLGPGGVDTT